MEQSEITRQKEKWKEREREKTHTTCTGETRRGNGELSTKRARGINRDRVCKRMRQRDR